MFASTVFLIARSGGLTRLRGFGYQSWEDLCLHFRTRPQERFSASAFKSNVKTPIRQCLNALGLQNVLYIVFTYQTPYKIVAPDNTSYALDQFVADIWDVYTPANQFGQPSYAHPYYVEAQTQGYVY